MIIMIIYAIVHFVFVDIVLKMLIISFFVVRYTLMKEFIFFTDTRTYHPLSCQKLLFGIEGLSTEENSDLFKNVQHYIKLTRRFETRNA